MPSARPQVSELVERLPPPVRSVTEVGRELVRESLEDRINGLAAEMAFFGLLGVFPGLIILTATLGFLDSIAGQSLADDVREAVTGWLNRLLTDEASAAVAAVRELFEQQRGGLIGFATLGALYAVSRSFSAVIVALDHAYDLEERRPWVRQRLIGLGLAVGTILIGVLVVGMVVIGPLLGGGEAVTEPLGLSGSVGFVWNWLRWPFAFAVLVMWATTIYDVGPAMRTRWRYQLPGAVFMALSWLGVSFGFSAYLRVAGDTNVVYGVLGGGLILLFWLYLLSLALLLGAELNAVLIVRRRGTVEAMQE